MISRDILQYVIRPTLQQTGTWCPASEMLVWGTGWIETHYDALVQHGNPKNGGLGLFQCEPSDFKDMSIWLNNGFNKGMLDRVLSATYYSILPVDPMSIVFNLRLAVLFCRLHYWRIKTPMPDIKDAEGMAYYHYKYYNGGGLGKTDKDKNTALFTRLIAGEV